MNLFPERDDYETRLAEFIEDRRRCYIVTMLLQTVVDIDEDFADLDYYEYDDGLDFFRPNPDMFIGCSEKKFTVSSFDDLLVIFPNAKNVLDRKKFTEV